MLSIIKDLLQKIINDIDTGNSNISEEQQRDIIHYLTDVTSPYVSKYTACKLLNISSSTFNEYIKKGKIPKGQKRQGFKELFWNKNELLESFRMK